MASLPCAPGAGTDVGHLIPADSDPLSEAESCDLAEMLGEAFQPLIESDPYSIVGEPASNEMEFVGAGGDQSSRQPSSSRNLSWAQFSNPGALGRSLGLGVVTGVLPKGMEEFFKKVKHNASTDAFQRRQGLFPLPVSFSRDSTGVH